MLNPGKHVFPVRKYRLIHERLLAMGARKENFLEPEPVERRGPSARPHAQVSQEAQDRRTLTKDELQALELPFSEDLASSPGCTSAGRSWPAERALADGLCVHVGGGFHHAFADHGEGFCLLNDIAVAVEKLQREGRIGKVMIVDCDVHQGNGTAAIFAKREDVFTFSIHQMDIYPAEKMTSTLDVGLWSGDGDARYLERAREAFPRALPEIPAGPGLLPGRGRSAGRRPAGRPDADESGPPDPGRDRPRRRAAARHSRRDRVRRRLSAPRYRRTSHQHDPDAR